jgi:anion transporter
VSGPVSNRANVPELPDGETEAGLLTTFAVPAINPRALILKAAFPVLAFVAILLAPTPEGLTGEGQRALAVMALAVGLWATDVLPIAVTGLVGVVLLVLLHGVPNITSALYGFSHPVAYFLIGILTLGLAVYRSGLAERLAMYLIRGAGGSPRMLYWQMLFSFAALTFALPSASTRGAIQVHIYERVLARWHVAQGSAMYKAVMLAMGSLNRLGSTALLAGGITPVVASSLLGDFSWTRWFVLMSIPFYANLVVGGALIYLYYRAGFRLHDAVDMQQLTSGPVHWPEVKAAVITLGTALLWFTDFLHGLSPTVPALIALAVILMPGVGVLGWRDFERNLGWSNFFAIATSLSLANALVTSGAAAWFSHTLVSSVEGIKGTPLLALLALAGASALVRLAVANISGYLALVIPVAMAAGESLGLNPLVCGMTAVVVGDSVVYYPAQSTSSVFIFQRANLGAFQVFRFGIVMTLVAIAVLFTLVLPYWSLVGEGLTR